MDFEIIGLNGGQTEEIGARLEEYDAGHMNGKREGGCSLGVIRDGKLIAGANGCMTAFKIFYVSTVYVDENYRMRSARRRLMEAVESEAAALGANFIRLDTFDFQGPGFYASLGYEQVGFYEIEEDGFAEYFYIKRLR